VAEGNDSIFCGQNDNGTASIGRYGNDTIDGVSARYHRRLVTGMNDFHEGWAFGEDSIPWWDGDDTHHCGKATTIP